MFVRWLRIGGLGVAMLVGMAPGAHAAMGSDTIMSRVDTNKDGHLSLAEVLTAAGNRYDLIRSKNGGRVTMLQLGGRFVPADLKEIGKTSPSVESAVSREEYLALAQTFFDKADTDRKAEEKSGSGTLSKDELASPAGKKLIGLLE